MIDQIAIAGYRSIRSIILRLGQLNVVTGANGSGKSNVYRSLKLIADAAAGRLAESLARDSNGKWQIKLLVGEEDTADLDADVILVTELCDAWHFVDGLGIALCPHRRLTATATNWLAKQTTCELEITPESFITSEPHYYVLGRKSVGGDARFNFAHARRQIQQVFGLIGGRVDLDVYESVVRQRET